MYQNNANQDVVTAKNGNQSLLAIIEMDQLARVTGGINDQEINMHLEPKDFGGYGRLTGP